MVYFFMFLLINFFRLFFFDLGGHILLRQFIFANIFEQFIVDAVDKLILAIRFKTNFRFFC